jgi:adenine-specific DNA-methyltransferase
MTLFDHIKSVLEQNENFCKDGKIFKNSVVEAGLKLDPSLLKLLLKDQKSKKHFFSEVEGIAVFDKAKFQKFVSNKQFLPDSFTAFKNKIGLTANGEYLTEANEVVLDFPYKDCVLEGGQTKEDQKRQEIFWNETLAPDEIDRLFEPKVFTNWKRYTSKGIEDVKSVSLNENLIIKGNNLIALHSLKKIYANRVKLIYIDPPYNTGNDSFQYNDNFNHSTWLTFMKNRLEVAKQLLKNDGLIFIQIDNKEEAYLKVLCDNIFGSDNYRNTIIVKKGMKSLQKQFKYIQRLNAGFDSILVYSKNTTTNLPVLFKDLEKKSSSSWNNHWRGTDRPTMRFELFGQTPSTGQWRWSYERTEAAVSNYKVLCDYIKDKGAVVNDENIDKFYEEYIYEEGINDIKDFELVRLSANNKPEHYIPPQTKILLSENWMDLSVAGRVTKFAHEKNEFLLSRIIEWVTNEDDIVLDFFLGSGSTAAVAHKLSRQYIGIEQMDYADLSAINRLSKVVKGKSKGIDYKGGGSFLSFEILTFEKEFAGKLKTVNTVSEIIEFFEKYHTRGILKYNVIEDAKSIFQDFAVSNDIDTCKKMIFDLLDKNNLYVNFYDIDDKSFSVSQNDILLTKNFYNNG